MKNIGMIIGTRPNFIKAFPVYKALKNDFNMSVIHTGQHFDDKMSKVFFEELEFPEPDYYLDSNNGFRGGELDNKLYVNNEDYLSDLKLVTDELLTVGNEKLGQLGNIKEKLEELLPKLNLDLVLVFGDVTSTCAGALASKKLNIPFAHVESGLRSGDLSMPEEVNRLIVDYLADYLFVTEKSGVQNLKKDENKGKIFLVGNTMIDTQIYFFNKAMFTRYNKEIGVKKNDYVLLTIHRPSNVDDLNVLKKIFDDLLEFSKDNKIVYPIHPRTRNMLEKINYIDKLQGGIILIDPVGYLEFTNLIYNSKYVITDSGGIQEETTALLKRCFTLRPNTERPSTLEENGGTNTLINNISKITNIDLKGNIPPLWDGNASGRIRAILVETIYKNI